MWEAGRLLGRNAFYPKVSIYRPGKVGRSVYMIKIVPL